MRKDGEPGASPKKRQLESCYEKRKSGGTVALAAAAIAIALVMVFGGEELNAISRGYNSQQAKLQRDFELLADGLSDLSDLIPELESNLETAVEGLTGTLVMRFGELWRNMEGKLQSVEREQRTILEAAKAANPTPPPPPDRVVVKSGTHPEFSIATGIEERIATRAFAESDTHWRLLRRYFLDRQGAATAADPSGTPPRPGSLQMVDANCVVGMHLWPTTSAIGAASYAAFGAAHGRRVLCFEDDSKHLDLIQATLLENKDLKHLVWVQTSALGAQAGTVKEVVEEGKEEQKVLEVRPLDDFVFGAVDLLRVDVIHGRELAVLQGARMAIQEGRVSALLTTLKPTEWDRAGFSIEEGVSTLTWIQAQRSYRAYIVFPSRLVGGGSCPAQLLSALGLVSPAGAEAAIRQAHDKGDEAAEGKLAKIGKEAEAGGVAPSFEEALKKLLEAMKENDWSCTLWLEEGVQGPIVSAPVEPEGGEGNVFAANAQQAQQLAARGTGTGAAQGTAEAGAAAAAAAAAAGGVADQMAAAGNVATQGDGNNQETATGQEVQGVAGAAAVAAGVDAATGGDQGQGGAGGVVVEQQPINTA